jgi:hypothetical protein
MLSKPHPNEPRRNPGWSVEQAARRLGVSVREYRRPEAGERWPNWETFPPSLRAERLVANVRDGSVAAVAQRRVRVLPSEWWTDLPMDIRQSAAVGPR